ncbi:hypothetical protein [Streptomyces sp. NPDC047079]|uniref:hypothetical protein n=1 Tax=Streptomyces sp. NPDC047079 TaxID=3154607 RepID=UPI0033CE4B2A
MTTATPALPADEPFGEPNRALRQAGKIGHAPAIGGATACRPGNLGALDNEGPNDGRISRMAHAAQVIAPGSVGAVSSHGRRPGDDTVIARAAPPPESSRESRSL